MNVEDTRYHLRHLVWKFRWARFVEIGLIAVGLSLLVYSLVGLFYPIVWVRMVLALVFLVGVVGFMAHQGNVFGWREQNLASYLDLHHPVLEDSSDLLVTDNPLTALEVVQKERVLIAFRDILSEVRVPWRLGQGLVVLMVGLMTFIFLPIYSKIESTGPADFNPGVVTDSTKTNPAIENILASVTPPPYTNIDPFQVEMRSMTVPMNSRIRWDVTFHGKAINPKILFGVGDSISMTDDKGNSFHADRKFTDNNFYQITWEDETHSSFQSEFYKIEIRKDQPPVAKIRNLPQFIEIGPDDSHTLIVEAELSDDYRVTQGHIVATVSKGSGESVKFREEKLLFNNSDRMAGARVAVERKIDLMALGLEPGDELYFYVEVSDNMIPGPNVSRTETFFIALRDTAVASIMADSGLGVDMMPEYFRSQRQIIIDTEKLLAEQRKIIKTDFNARSNELGFDQKALRLRYGQFLGMEDELGIGVTNEISQQQSENVDPLAEFGHQHDTKNEHNLLADKKVVFKDPGHQEEETADANKDPLKEFLHAHDSEEEATFFDQTIKAKLQAALTLMWDSELHLRLYEPKKSLPFQYKILALLKEISQDSRVYVHRVGFDPPPIKEEKRLTGDLDEILNSVGLNESTENNSYRAIAAAITRIEELLQEPEINVDDSTKLLFNRAGYEVAAEELRKSGAYLFTLSTLRKLVDGKMEADEMRNGLLRVRSDLWNILPLESNSPNRARRTWHPLDRSLLQILETESRD